MIIFYHQELIGDLTLCSPTTNGPSGSGNLSRLNKVVAGTDRVAVDAFCCRYLSLEPEKELMIKKSYENKLGEINLNKLNIREI